MSQSLLLLQKILVMLIMIIMGFLTVKSKKLKSTDSKVISNLCFDWVIPCSLLNAFQADYDPEKAASFLFACGAAIFSISMCIIVTRLIKKPLGLNPAEEGSVIFSNSAGIAAPLIASVYGSEALFYAAAHMGFQNLFIFVYLPMIMSRDAKTDWKKILLSRNVFSILVGLTFFFTGFRLPGALGTAVKTVGGMLSPMSMFMIGMLMGGVDFKAVLKERRVWFVNTGRLVVYPLLFMLIVKVSGILNALPYAREVLKYTMIATSAPCAALVTQMSALYRPEKEAQEAGSVNVASSLLCVLTMPLLLWVYEMVM